MDTHEIAVTVKLSDPDAPDEILVTSTADFDDLEGEPASAIRQVADLAVARAAAALAVSIEQPTSPTD